MAGGEESKMASQPRNPFYIVSPGASPPALQAGIQRLRLAKSKKNAENIIFLVS